MKSSITEHSTITCYVFILLHFNADNTVCEIFLPTRARGSHYCRDYADNIAIFSVLLQVN